MASIIHRFNKTIAPLRLALASATVASLPPAIFTLESVIYSAFPDDDIQREEEEDSDPDAPVLVEAPSDTEVGSPSSSVRSTAAARVSEGKELEVVFEEGDLGITIKVRTYHFIAFAR